MSSQTQSRLIGAIRRIARQDPEVRSSLRASQNRGGKPGSVGLALDATEALEATEDPKGEVNRGTSSTDTSSPACGMQGEDPADFGAALAGLECVQDCETGDPVCFEGADFVPPDGWETADLGPSSDDSWREGFSWTTPDGIFSSPEQWRTTADNCLLCGRGGWVFKSQFFWEFSANCFGVKPGGCNGSTVIQPIVDESNTEPPRDEIWPEDDCTNLAIKDGKIVGSKRDPENDGSYSRPRDEIELCDSETGERILIRPSSGGGWRTIKSLDGDIDPDTQSGYLYGKDGQRIRQISPNEFRDPFV